VAANTKHKRLVIVESPAKAKTIAGYLGDDFVVESSVGHIRDLPERAADIPEEYKKQAWARLGVDVEHDFEPLYIVDPDKRKKVSELKKLLASSDELLLATDEDREGEAIAWHLLQVLNPKVPVRRMVFHEITRDAIDRALGETREVDQRLVDAQETRRILDRLYGYEISPVLWKKIMPRLSAGRVQSVATRLVVQREKERRAFVAAQWWDIEATFDPESFTARLVTIEGKRVALGRDFGPDGKSRSDDIVQLDESEARGLAGRLKDSSYTVGRVERKPYVRRPSPPFMTSTLQQEASRKLRYTAQTTMRVAQRLYENGYITYMRTDSTTLSESALKAARAQAAELFGAEFVPAKPRQYERKVKNAQEAHEAIRPSGDSFRTPQQVQKELSRDEHALYELIWIRTLASQMEDAKGQTVSLRIAGASSTSENVEFGADVAGRENVRQIASDVLREVGLEGRADHFPHELSGGEQQRVAIARALASGNRILLADEPTGELDFRTGVQILSLLRSQSRTETAVLVVTHNREIARVADRVVELSSGRIVGDGPPAGGQVAVDELRW